MSQETANTETSHEAMIGAQYETIGMSHIEACQHCFKAGYDFVFNTMAVRDLEFQLERALAELKHNMYPSECPTIGHAEAALSRFKLIKPRPIAEQKTIP